MSKFITAALMIFDMIVSLCFAYSRNYAAATFFLLWAFYQESKLKRGEDE